MGGTRKHKPFSRWATHIHTLAAHSSLNARFLYLSLSKQETRKYTVCVHVHVQLTFVRTRTRAHTLSSSRERAYTRKHTRRDSRTTLEEHTNARRHGDVKTKRIQSDGTLNAHTGGYFGARARVHKLTRTRRRIRNHRGLRNRPRRCSRRARYCGGLENDVPSFSGFSGGAPPPSSEA